MQSLLAILIPIVSAVILFVLPKANAKQFALISAIISLGVTIASYFVFDINGGEQFSINVPWIEMLGIQFHIGMDGISLLMVFLCNLLMPFIILSAFKDEYSNTKVFYALMLVMQGAMNGVFVAMDMFLYYIFWELALIPAYFLVLRWGTGEARKITIKFFIYTLFGSLFMLVGIIWMAYYGTNGSTDISAIYNLVIDERTQMFLFFAFMLAYAIKIPVFPFHTWQPDTYTSAPAPVTMMLSGIMLKMGLYSIIRWVLPVMPDAVNEYGIYVIILATIGVLYASSIAWVQKDLKRLFAYASLAHVGIIAAGLLTATAIGIQGGLLQMVAHGIYAVGLFYICQIIYRQQQNHVIDKLGGIRLKAPLFAGMYLVILLASVSLPLTNAFPGEFMLLSSIYTFNPWICLFAGSGVILGAMYMLSSYQKVMLGETTGSTNHFHELNFYDKVVLIPIVILIFIFGLFPNSINDLTAPAVDAIINQMQSHTEAININR
ncbi:MAG: NADH-quinone oxidoreductase subunit M [Fimbriimonadaceae bacterium]|nr:NADH-quinone oxidoreductase subunit M [Chitinophagales bacterium]